MIASTPTHGRGTSTAARLCASTRTPVGVVGAVGEHERAAPRPSAAGRAPACRRARRARPPRRGGPAAGARRPRRARRSRAGTAPAWAPRDRPTPPPRRHRRMVATANRDGAAARRARSPVPSPAIAARAAGSAAARRRPRSTRRASSSSPSSGPNTASPPLMTAAFSAKMSSRVCAEHLGVLQGDVGEHHHRRRDHVGGVETPAEAGLQRHGLHPALREGEQRGDGEDLELGGLTELLGQARRPGRADALHAARRRAARPPDDRR